MSVDKVIAIFLAVLVVIGIVIVVSDANAEETSLWVLCNPKSSVSIRFSPGKGNNVLMQVECGEEIKTDGKTSGEWIHVVGGCGESEDGWIHKGYVSHDKVYLCDAWEMTASAKVRIRNRIGGKIKGTLRKGETVTVYALTDSVDGWAVTNRGYIMTKYLDDGLGGV